MSGDSLSNLVPAPQGSNRPNEFVFDGTIRCVILNGEPYWSILDTYKIYGKSQNPTTDWKRHKETLELQGYNLEFLLDYVFVGSDGRKKKKTPITNLEGFMRIAQVADFKEWEPLRRKMAKLMAENIRNSFPRDAQWQAVYQGEMISHKQLMDALDEAVWFLCQGIHVKQAVEAVFKGLYKRTRQQIAERIGLSEYFTLENNQSRYALNYQSIAKAYASERLDERAELGFEEARRIIREAAEAIAPQVHAMSQLLGRDIATNLPLLASGILDEMDKQVEEDDEDDKLRGVPLVPKPEDPWMM
jgi:hypothetical protein